MTTEKKESWLNWLAITTILFSASATLSTFKGGGFSTRALLAQTNASDTWALYQSKSIKQHSFELNRDLLELQSAHLSGTDAAAYQRKIAEYSASIERYKKEKGEAEAQAKSFEDEKRQDQKNGGVFGLAVVFLQVAIMLSGLAALLKKKPVWVVGLLFGLVGAVYFGNGFLYAAKGITFLIPKP